MKKILSILGSVTLIGTNTTILVTCNKNITIPQYTEDELAKLKAKKNKYNK